MYVVGALKFKFLKTSIEKKWSTVMEIEVYYYNDGYFVITFATMEEKNSCLYSGPYTLANRHVTVNDWKPDFCFKYEVLKVVLL